MSYQFCPQCGKPILELLESIPAEDEVKHVLTCGDCEIIVNVFESYSVPSQQRS